LLKVRARDLRDVTAEVDDVLGPLGRRLVDCVAGARDTRRAVMSFSVVMKATLSSARQIDPRAGRAADILERAGGELPVGAVAAQLSMGERQLERLFDADVGVGPKLYARVARLRRAARALSSRVSQAQIAIECGYADEAHLIHEFQALAGLTPVAFRRARAMSEIDNPSHGPVATLPTK
jgi:transcriptional regulator GlxA family with amidase domain